MPSEADRIRTYSQSRRSIQEASTWLCNRALTYFHVQRHRYMLEFLGREGCFPLAGKRILEVGCGSGDFLVDLVRWGSWPEDLAGVDLCPESISDAKRRLSSADVRCADASALPFLDHSFDLVFQITAFTSMLDATMKQNVAHEMIRVLKPTGRIIWYDFQYDNPKNPNVAGIDRREIASLFPLCSVSHRRVTLAPPLMRLIAPASWMAAVLLEACPLLRTHLLCRITARSGAGEAEQS